MEDAFLPEKRTGVPIEGGQCFRSIADTIGETRAVSDVETFRILGFDWPICRASLWSFNTQILLLETRFERTETGSISRPVL